MTTYNASERAPDDEDVSMAKATESGPSGARDWMVTDTTVGRDSLSGKPFGDWGPFTEAEAKEFAENHAHMRALPAEWCR